MTEEQWRPSLANDTRTDEQREAEERRIDEQMDRIEVAAKAHRETLISRDTFAYWRDRWAALDNDALERALRPTCGRGGGAAIAGDAAGPTRRST